MDWIKYFLLFAGLIVLPMLFTEVVSRGGFIFEEKIEIFLSRKQSQILKGIAILCVILCHYMGRFGNGVVYFTPFGGIGVAIFLILSAYGLNTSWNRGGDCVKTSQ